MQAKSTIDEQTTSVLGCALAHQLYLYFVGRQYYTMSS
jgi:hypothetical protein